MVFLVRFAFCRRLACRREQREPQRVRTVRGIARRLTYDKTSSDAQGRRRSQAGGGARTRGPRFRHHRVVVAPPEADEPVVPLVPDPLLVPAVPVPGVVAVELPDEPIPDVVPEREDGEVVEAEGDIDPLAEPPADPMPEAVPDAEPDIVEPHAANAAVKPRAIRIFVIADSC